MSRSRINFNAGPAALPPEVVHEAAKATREYNKTGISILELPHRGTEFAAIVEESCRLVRELCGLNNDYEVVWLHGGGRMQFAMLPMNFLGAGHTAAYADSGHWAAEAIEYARYYGNTFVAGSSKDNNYNHLPELGKAIPADARYLHITTNNTIYGTQYRQPPATQLPLVADMSSDILSETRDYTAYSMFYAAAQKNIGTPGVALAVIRRSFLEKAADNLPPLFSYKAQVKERSVLNTANVSGIYISLLTLRWIKERTIARIERENMLKAELLYNAIDESDIFTAHVANSSHRSRMNVCFTARDTQTEKAFLARCEKEGIAGVGGHRSVGGFRASLYNAISADNVRELVEVMKDFERKL